MNKEDIIRMARKAGIFTGGHPMNPWSVYPSDLERFAALVAAAEREAWRNAAIRVGENLATCGPAGYYDFTSQQWLDWAIYESSKMQDDYMQLGACGEREECAKLCEGVKGPHKSYGARVAKECAAAIRARSNT